MFNIDALKEYTQDIDEIYGGFYKRHNEHMQSLERELWQHWPQTLTEMQKSIIKNANIILSMSQPQHEALYEQMKQLAAATGSKSISEACGGIPLFKRNDIPAEPELAALKNELNSFVKQSHAELPQPLQGANGQLTEREQAEVELSFIHAAIALAQGSNAIGAEVTIAGITVGVSVNARLIPILKDEAHEIEKYLRGEPNNYE